MSVPAFLIDSKSQIRHTGIPVETPQLCASAANQDLLHLLRGKYIVGIAEMTADFDGLIVLDQFLQIVFTQAYP